MSPRGRPATLKRGLRSGWPVVHVAMLLRVFLLAALGGALVAKHYPRGGHLENDDDDDDDTVVIEGELQ